jgi:poly(3-hydroxybutyrate) depolymerase
MMCGMWLALLVAAVLLSTRADPAGHPGSAGQAIAQELPRGTLVAEVRCLANPAQTYALYVPSTYSPDRGWSVLMAFHPAARGAAMVEKYRAAAEQYGYIVAGSNTSRNGPWDVSMAAVETMSADLGRRFSIDAQRVYLTGMSGGARVAMQVALGPNTIAGVIASSAGFPDSKPRETVPFAVFGTAGTEDFNYIEMRTLDRALRSPHRLAIFSGGHTLPTDEVARDAIEWMELQAMKAGRRRRDEAFVDRMLASRRQAIEAASDPAAAFHLLEWVVADFNGLRDVTAEAAAVEAMSKRSDVKKALARERSSDDGESRMLSEIFELEARLDSADARFAALGHLKGRLSQWSRQAQAPADSPERSRARRLLGAVLSGAGSRVSDAEYRKLLDHYRR